MNSTNVQGIRFRAFDKMNNRMIYPCSSKNDTYLVFEESGWFIVDHFSGKNETILKSEDGDLMRFTGLRDKSGKEIYEGDIVDHDGKNCVIDFKGGSFGIDHEPTPRKGYERILNSTSWVVIGNIYEHPHLLKPEGITVSEGLIDNGV